MDLDKKIHLDVDAIVFWVIQSGLVSEGGAILSHHDNCDEIKFSDCICKSDNLNSVK